MAVAEALDWLWQQFTKVFERGEVYVSYSVFWQWLEPEFVGKVNFNFTKGANISEFHRLPLPPA